jgi:hypothetical protein
MIYHFSLHTVGLIAGLILLLVSLLALFCRSKIFSRSFRARARLARCCSRSI